MNPLSCKSGPRVAPRTFRQGADLSDEGLKYSFQDTYMPTISEKIVFHLPKGVSMLRRGL